jgi:serine/threonine-protein kinase RsbW
VAAFLDECLHPWGVQGQVSFALHLAVEELFTNAVKYAGPEAGDVEISVRGADGLVTIRMSIEGTAEFDVTTAPPPDPSIPLAERRVGGLGLFLARSMVDSLEYQFAGGRSTVTFTKTLKGPHVLDHRQ